MAFYFTAVSVRSYTYGRRNVGGESRLAQESESFPYHQIPKKINSSDHVLWPANHQVNSELDALTHRTATIRSWLILYIYIIENLLTSLGTA